MRLTLLLLLVCHAGRAAAQNDAGASSPPVRFDAAIDGAVAPDAPTAATTAPGAPVGAPTPVGAQPDLAAIQREATEILGAIDGDDLISLDLEDLLENIVVTATKSAVKEDEAPAITTVISREEIQRWGYQSIDEVLKHVAGVYVIDDHIVANTGIRGISGGLRSESGLIKVMIDGRSVSFRSTSGNWLGPELIPLSAVQQIEIIRGPASSLYGADAFLGVINVVTRRPDRIDGGELSIQGNHEGHFGWGTDLAMGTSVGNWQVLAAYRRLSEDRSGLVLPVSSPAPRLPSYAPADLAARGLTRDSNVGFIRLAYRLGARADLSVTGHVSQIDRGAEFADWAQLTHGIDANGRVNGTMVSLRQGTVGADLTLHLSSRIDLRLSGSFFTGGPTTRDRIEVGNDLFYVRRDFGYTGGEAGAEAAWRPSERLSVLVGGGMILDHERLPSVYDVLKSPVGTAKPGDQIGTGAGASNDLSNIGVNALAMWTPVSRLTITGGARYDHHNVYGGKPSGRLGGVLTLLSNLHFKLLYGSAFKAPSPQLLYGSPLMPGDIAGNVALRPSYVHTVEGQLSYRPYRYLVVTSGLAYSALLDQATFAQRGINQVALNVSRVQSLSWETELRLDYKRKMQLYANVALNHALTRLNDDNYVASLSNYRNPAYPKLIVNGGLSAAIPRLPLRVSGELSFVSSRRSSSANTLEAGGVYELGSYTLVGATLRTVGLQLFTKKETAIVLVGRNLTDAKIADPGFAGIDYPQLRRTVLLQLTQEF